MKSDKIEKYIQNNITLNFTYPDKDKMKIVDNTKTPNLFVTHFYELADGDFPNNIDTVTYPPNQNTFAVTYYAKNKGENKFTDEYRDCWIRRCQATYPSLVRDMHFTYLLKDYNERFDLFDEIIYSVDYDVNQGADVVIKNDGKTYYVNLYVNTQKSNDFIDKKKDIRHPKHDKVEIHLPIDKSDSKKIQLSNGKDMWLYSKEHIKQLRETIYN